ncbi:MAG TPA: NAD(P)/FAD-dependent oxidoreductase [Thermoanaerobaculia bacterium]|nr:NAD(P)/FAD-dependent oxidoreductase [Thermoanaerobaculia bacterium]
MNAAVGSRGLDVVVIGAGPAGSATALRLARHGAGQVLLADSGGFDGFRIGESIPPDTGLLLAELDLLTGFLAQGHEPCLGSCSSWGEDELGYNDFVTNPHGHGWHLDRNRFDAFLAHQAAERGVRLELGWRLETAARRPEGGWRLAFKTPGGSRRSVDAGIVVDATGQRASFARLAGGRRRIADRLICVAGRFGLGTGFGKLTLLESRGYGWWYAARLADGAAVVAVTTDPATCRQRNLRDPVSWLCHLAQTRHLGARLDGSRIVPGSLRAWPVSSFCLEPSAGEDWLAVGDAASAYDPLTSQGIHKALAGGLRAGDAIARRRRGEAMDFAAYGESLARSWEEYVGLRAHLYAREARWRDQPFWQSRQARQEAASTGSASST